MRGRKRSAGAVSGGNAGKGRLLSFGKAAPGQAFGNKPRKKASRSNLLANDGELYVFAQSDDRVAKERAMRRRQLKWLWKRLRELTGGGSLPRRDADEARCRTGQRQFHCMAPGRYRDGRGKAPRSPTHSTVRSCDVLAAAKGVICCCAPISPENDPTLLWQYLYPARCRGTGIQKPEAGSGDTPRIPSRRAPNRSPHFHRIPRLLSAGHAPASAACPVARADRAQRSGEIRGGPDDRCPPTDNRRGGSCC